MEAQKPPNLGTTIFHSADLPVMLKICLWRYADLGGTKRASKRQGYRFFCFFGEIEECRQPYRKYSPRDPTGIEAADQARHSVMNALASRSGSVDQLAAAVGN